MMNLNKAEILTLPETPLRRVVQLWCTTSFARDVSNPIAYLYTHEFVLLEALEGHELNPISVILGVY